ncbi:Tripartite tricarboxylate transporter TctA family [Oligella ureolytica]|uniref:Tripartite tricarboxylate transporter TctA family n=1 Tax=Oligella ureolytica TaxID=90244 RepID=A0A378XCQ0_9BURK|nr:tripartite tricarboxylate transporter permease [Oligella ureolytica]QPT40398.1 tripartite tricarboxylate transporter permease [Oligella ureolytica]SUA50973.1 Tripartite tricarboxylate transporter TctA family [Oligella ureolytica]
MDLLSNALLGLGVALSFNNLLYCFLGVLIGTFLGVIPGVGVLAAISMLFPITFHMEPTTALIMLAGIWYGTTFGGSTTSILLNVPGTPSNAVTCLDGYPMAKQGRAGVALFMTTMASLIGCLFGLLILMFFSPIIANYAISFAAPEYFALMVLGLVAATSISNGSFFKGLLMVVLGIAIGVVGTDIYTGSPRFVFGILDLSDGVSLIALAMGVFGATEVIASIGKVNTQKLKTEKITLKSMLPTKSDVNKSWGPMARGSGIGTFFGTLPGTGPSLAAFVSYAIEKRVSKTPERFGHGAIEGIMAPETSNSSADITSFIPTLTLGIPGSPTMALMLGALMIHGIAPGPQLMTEQPELFWGLIMSFWIGNILLVLLNIPLIGLWVRILTVPYHYLFPAVLMFICLGTYSVNYSIVDILLVAGFGLGGYILRAFYYPMAPLILGFVLGPLIEQNFRRAMLLSDGSFTTFIERPISLVILIITLALMLWGVWSTIKQKRKLKAFNTIKNAA